MSKTSKVLAGILAALLLTTAVFAAMVAIKPINFKFGSQKLAETEAIVQKICAENGWETVIYDKTNIIYATKDQGTWLMTVRIYFTNTTMELRYNSSDLDYDQAKNTIDQRYMEYMTTLSEQIKAALPKAPAAAPKKAPAKK